LYLKLFRASNHFLNNLLLAILLKNFVGCFRSSYTRYLKQSIIIVQGVIVCLALFNLQGTVALALAVSLLILSRSVPFVKNFFHLFSNFFEPISLYAPHRGDLHILPFPVHFVKHFFHLFIDFFIPDFPCPPELFWGPCFSDFSAFDAAVPYPQGMASGRIRPSCAGLPGG